MLSSNAAQIAIGGFSMSHEPSPGASPGEDVLSGVAEPWERWETSLVLGSIALGVAGLVLLGWLVDRFILS
jgi:hypothetical protein